MNYQYEIKKTCAELARVRRATRQTKWRIARIKARVAITVAIEVIRRIRSGITERLETTPEYMGGRRELAELESERAALESRAERVLRWLLEDTRL